MDILADLGTRTDRRPSVHHSAFVNIGAKIDEGRHQHNARRDVGGPAYDAIGHGAKAGRLPSVVVPAFPLVVDLVPPGGTLRTAFLQFHVLETEAEEHGLLCPLVDVPSAVIHALGDANPAFVQRCQGTLDGVTAFAGRHGRYLVADVPSGFDRGFELSVGHLGTSCSKCRRHSFWPDRGQRRFRHSPRGGFEETRTPPMPARFGPPNRRMCSTLGQRS